MEEERTRFKKQCESAGKDSPWPGYSGLIMALFAIQWRDESILQGTENMGPMWKRQTILDIRLEWNPRLWQIGVCCTQEALCVTWTACPPSLANLPFEGNFMASLFHFNVILGVKSSAMCFCNICTSKYTCDFLLYFTVYSWIFFKCPIWWISIKWIWLFR